MSEMKIPNDRSPIDPTLIPSQTKESNHPPSKNSPSTTDALTLASTHPPNTPLTESSPQLKTPQTISLAQYLEALGSAKTDLRQQLSASDLIDQSTRRKSNEATAIQAQALAKLLEEREHALENVNNDVKKVLEEFQKLLNSIKAQTKEQQDLLDQINNGNTTEKQKYQELIDAYNSYINNLKNIGAIDQGNGKYLIPEHAKEQYNEFTKQYQHAVQNFNHYWTDRLNLLTHYHSLTANYNQTTSKNNQTITDFINKYKLSDYMKKHGISIPNQTHAPFRDISEYPKQIDAPLPLGSTPATIEVPPLPNYAQSIARSGPPTLPNLENYPPFNTQQLSQPIYEFIYSTKISNLDREIDSKMTYWAFLNAQNLFNPVQDSTPDPLLNDKKILRKLLAPILISTTHPIQIKHSDSITQALGLDKSHIATILGRSLLTQAARQLDLKLTEKQINQTTDRLLILSVGLISNNSLQALFPVINTLSKSIASLPKDSPAFAILFATSFANRIQETIQQGLTNEALQTFINNFPELTTLSDTDKNQLTNILNLGLLLTASKLLESNLGLPGLLTQILPPLLPSNETSPSLLPQIHQENTQSQLKLEETTKNYFISQGYPEESAHFLAQTNTTLVNQGLATPSATIISPETINQPLLVNTVKASLILSNPPNYPPTQATSIAQQAVDRTLAEGPYYSTAKFRTALNSHLQELGIHDQAPEIALDAVIIPPEDPTLAALQSSPITLSPTQLMNILEKRSLQLLVPQLGAQLAQQITHEVAKTLFGTPNPDVNTLAEIKSPYSLIHGIKNQLSHLNLKHQQEYTITLHETLKETMKTTEEFDAFSLKIMDPAYLFFYSTYSDIMYANPSHWKKPVDILI